jgi:cell division protein FtsL
MRFLRQNQYVLLFLAVLVFSSVMVVRQFLANQSAHSERREDLILLQERGDTKTSAWLYQRLIQELPELSERSLVEDLARTALLVDPKKPELENLVWKYYVSVKKELQRRAEHRIDRVVAKAQKE